MNLPYFPEILPDELLYSVLARHHRHTGSTGAHRTAVALFGKQHIAAAYDLPVRLDNLARRIDGRRGLTAERLIQDTTLFPYYAAFRSSDDIQALKAGLRGGGAGIHSSMGVSKFGVRRLKALRFCPACVPEMLAGHGEAYWRRSHQLPGTLVCPDHGCPLCESAVPLSLNGKYLYVAADGKACPADARPVRDVADPAMLRKLLGIAVAGAGMLRARPGQVAPREAVESYKERLSMAGFMTSPRSVDVAKLSAGFQEHWAGGPQELRGGPEDGWCGHWLANMVRPRCRKYHHPLHHILLRDFLDALPDAPRKFRSVVAATAFGPGPWPCRNRLAGHFGGFVVETLTVSSFASSMSGRLTCGCGYIYTRSVSLDGKLGAPQHGYYGPLLMPALERLMTPASSLYQVARELGVAPSTLLREAAALGLDTPWRRKHARKLRKRLRPKPPPSRAGQARPADPPRKTRIDWDALDAECAARFRRCAEEILAVEPPVRVSLTEIERRLRRPQWFARCRQRLPSATAELQKIAEDFGCFRTRRVRYAIRRLPPDCPPPAIWNVMRAAGLGTSDLPMAKAELEKHFASRSGRAGGGERSRAV